MKQLVNNWFLCWTQGDFENLPISDGFTHTSPFGTIIGKAAYMRLVAANRDKFLGYVFEIHDALYEEDRACVRYTAKQGQALCMDVSEWYYAKEGLIYEVIAHYHIGEIRNERKIADY